MACSSYAHGVITAAALGGVNLEDKFINHVGLNDVRTAGIRINSNGTVQWLKTYQELELNPLTDWIIPNGAASASYDVRLTNLTWITKDEGFIISPGGNDTYTIPMNLSADGDSDGNEDIWYDLGTSREWLFLDEDTADPGGLQSATFDIEIRIGGITIATAAMDWTVNSIAGGGGGGGGCFEYGTEFRMADGSLKEVQDIVFGDVMEEGGLVDQTITGNGKSETWFDVDGVHVTGTHTVCKNGEWMRVRAAGYPAVDTINQYYVVTNENHRMVAANGHVFGDYTETDYLTVEFGDWMIDTMNDKGHASDAGREVAKAIVYS